MTPAFYAVSSLTLPLATPHENRLASNEPWYSRTDLVQEAYSALLITVFCVKANHWSLYFVLWTGRRHHGVLDELFLSFPLESWISRSCWYLLQMHLFAILNTNSLQLKAQCYFYTFWTNSLPWAMKIFLFEFTKTSCLYYLYFTLFLHQKEDKRGLLLSSVFPAMGWKCLDVHPHCYVSCQFY